MTFQGRYVIVITHRGVVPQGILDYAYVSLVFPFDDTSIHDYLLSARIPFTRNGGIRTRQKGVAPERKGTSPQENIGKQPNLELLAKFVAMMEDKFLIFDKCVGAMNELERLAKSSSAGQAGVKEETSMQMRPVVTQNTPRNGTHTLQGQQQLKRDRIMYHACFQGLTWACILNTSIAVQFKHISATTTTARQPNGQLSRVAAGMDQLLRENSPQPFPQRRLRQREGMVSFDTIVFTDFY